MTRHPETLPLLLDVPSLDMPCMSELEDHDLLSLARSGHSTATAALFDRYRHVALRLSVHLTTPSDGEDVMAEAFAQVFTQLDRGKGPERSFRAYLFTAIRHEAGRRNRQRHRVLTSDDDTVVDTAVAFSHGIMDGFERDLVRAAYSSLPERWPEVLWALDVEGRAPP